MSLRKVIRKEVAATRARIRKWLLLAGIAMAVLLLLALAAGVLLPLCGRVRFARAAGELEALFGRELVFDLARLETPPLPPYENAAEWLLDGVASIDLSEEELERRNEATDLPRSEWSVELEESVRALLDKNRLALETLHAAADIERSDYGIRYRDGSAARIPNLLAFLSAAKLLHLEGRVAFADGDVAGGLAAAKAVARIATSLDQEHFLIMPLIGLAIERMLLRLLGEVLETTGPWARGPALLSELAALIPTADRAAKTRELLVIDCTRWSLEVRDGTEFQEYPPGVRYLFGHWAAADVLFGCRQMVARISVPFGRDPERFMTSAETSRLLGQRLLEVVVRIPSIGIPVAELMNLDEGVPRALGGAVPKFQRVASERQLVRAAFILRRHGVAGGSYPRQRPELAELTRPDPYTGRLVVYRRGDDGSLDLELDGAARLWAELREDRRLGPRWREDKRLRRSVEAYVREGAFSVTLPPPPGGGRAFEERLEATAVTHNPCGEGLPAGSLGKAAERIVEAMAVTRDPFELSFLLSAFPGLGEALLVETGRQVAERLVASMAVSLDPGELYSLSRGLRTLLRVVPAEVMREIEERIVAATNAACDPVQLAALGGVLGKKLPAELAERAARWGSVPLDSSPLRDPFRLAEITHLALWGEASHVSPSGETSQGMPDEVAARAFCELYRDGARQPEDRLEKRFDRVRAQLPAGAAERAAGLLDGSISGDCLEALGVKLTAAPTMGEQLERRLACAEKPGSQGLAGSPGGGQVGDTLALIGSLAEVPTQAVERIAARWVEGLASRPDSDRSQIILAHGVIRAATILSVRTTAERAMDRIAGAMAATRNPQALRLLAESLTTLNAPGTSLPAPLAATAAAGIVEAIVTEDPGGLYELVEGLRVLGEDLPGDAAAIAAQRLVETMDVTEESLWALPLHALRTLGEKLPAVAVEKAADRVVEAMALTQEPNELRILASGLGELGSKLPDDAAVSAGQRLVEAMDETQDAYRWRLLAEGLRDLGEKLPAVLATRAAQRILDGMDPVLRSRSWDAYGQLRALGDGMEALVYKFPRRGTSGGIPIRMFEDAVERIVKAVVAGQVSPCHGVKDFLTALGEHLDAEAAEKLAGRIVDGLEATREPVPLSCLAELLGTLGERLPEGAVEKATDRIVEAMVVATEEWRSRESYALSYLFYGLRGLGSKLPGAAADKAADRIVEAMAETQEGLRARAPALAYRSTFWKVRLRCLAEALGSLGEKLSDGVAARSLAAVVSATPFMERRWYYDVSCDSLCVSAATLLRRDNLQPIVELVQEATCPYSDRQELLEKVGELVGESFGTAGDRLQERLSAFMRWAGEEGHLPNRSPPVELEEEIE